MLLACSSLGPVWLRGSGEWVRRSGPGLIRRQPPSYPPSVSHHTPSSICLFIHSSDPLVTQHKHLLPLLLFMPEDLSAGWSVSLSSPHHFPPYPKPPALATVKHCAYMCACVFLGLHGFRSYTILNHTCINVHAIFTGSHACRIHLSNYCFICFSFPPLLWLSFKDIYIWITNPLLIALVLPCVQ